MKKLISKIRSLLRRLTRNPKLSFTVSLTLPPFFKVEVRYSSEIEKKAANDDGKRKRFIRRKRFLRR